MFSRRSGRADNVKLMKSQTGRWPAEKMEDAEAQSAALPSLHATQLFEARVLWLPRTFCGFLCDWNTGEVRSVLRPRSLSQELNKESNISIYINIPVFT